VVICSDKFEHQQRIEARPRAARASNWPEVASRELDAAGGTAIMIDTASRSVEQSLAELLAALQTK
jgi:hypothetical protein